MFLSHKKDLESHQWHVLEQYSGTCTLLKKDDSFYYQSNLCPHQGSKIRTGKGDSLPVCPYHGWSWDADGNPKGNGTVGHSTGSSQCKNQHVLAQHTAHDWNGFLFGCPVPVDHDISGDYELVEYRQDIIRASHVVVMDLFLDVDHIPVVHPGVYDRISIPNVKDLAWHSWYGGSVQTVQDRNGNLGALWMALYPNTMFEWQPGAVFVMVNEVVDSQTTRSHVFKYRDLNSSDKQWSVNSNVWEEAWRQDRAQAEAMEPGWRMVGEDNLDPEKLVFRAWLKNNPGT